MPEVPNAKLTDPQSAWCPGCPMPRVHENQGAQMPQHTMPSVQSTQIQGAQCPASGDAGLGVDRPFVAVGLGPSWGHPNLPLSFHFLPESPLHPHMTAGTELGVM